MRVRIGDKVIPYPLGSLRGRFRLAGFSQLEAEQAVSEIQASVGTGSLSEKDLDAMARGWISSNRLSLASSFEKLAEYEEARRSKGRPPLVVAIEGASATGKTMLALEIVNMINATRFISTDTIRQILRTIMPESKYPELHCHTYQAHKYRQEGSVALNPEVRGFIAQTGLIMPGVVELARRVLAEGAVTVIEGVHIVPGSLVGLGPSVLELVVSPTRETHEAMFLAKHAAGKLRSVTEDENRRYAEFEATVSIQEYMLEQAQRKGINVVDFEDYEESLKEIAALILSRIESLT